MNFMGNTLITKSVNELHFVQLRQPASTVEIDIGTLPDQSGGYALLVEAAVAPLAVADMDLRATIYVAHGPSVSFGNYGHSAFLSVAGDGRVLAALQTSFGSASGLKVRSGDQSDQSQAIPQYHLEDGLLWRPDEEHVWYADAREFDCEIFDDDMDDGEDGEGRIDDAGENDGGSARIELPARFRAARSDASVGSIVRSIESVFGLPEGSVALRGPDKKPLRSDAAIRTLRKRWE
jgi:hypothetical protein